MTGMNNCLYLRLFCLEAARSYFTIALSLSLDYGRMSALKNNILSGQADRLTTGSLAIKAAFAG